MVDKEIKKTVKKMNKKALGVKSESMAFRYGYDYTFLANLLDEVGISDIELREDMMDLVPDELLENVSVYIDDLGNLAKEVIEMFKKINFYCYLREGHTSISNADKVAILKEYLLKKMPWAYNLYKDLCDSGHVFMIDNDHDYGVAYLMPVIDEYYMAINKYSSNDLSDIETTIHELMHIFVAKLAHSYSWRNHHNIISGFSKESASLYSSLSFFEFCMEQHIYMDDALLHRNLSDYEILTFFKLINYFYEMGVKEGKEVTISEGVNYNFDDDCIMEQDRDMAFFRYPKGEYSSGSFTTFLYGTGYVEAYNLLKLEREGRNVKDIINDFVLIHQIADVDTDLFKTNLNFMGREIQNHQKSLEKKYPIPGYFVN